MNRTSQKSPTPGVITTTVTAGNAAGLDPDMIRAIALDKRVTTLQLAEAAVAEAAEIMAIAKVVNEGALADKFDLMGVARDYVVNRSPVSQFRADVIEQLAALDQHIDTARPREVASDSPIGAVAREFWSKRGSDNK